MKLDSNAFITSYLLMFINKANNPSRVLYSST